MSAEVLNTKVALFRGSLPIALREAAQWIENADIPIWNINVESEDDGSYVVFVYFHNDES